MYKVETVLFLWFFLSHKEKNKSLVEKKSSTSTLQQHHVYILHIGFPENKTLSIQNNIALRTLTYMHSRRRPHCEDAK